MNEDPTISKVGSLAAFGLALAYLATGLSAGMMPAELQGRPDITPHQFWMVLSQNPTAHLAYHWAWVAVGFFGLAAVPAISLLVWRSHRGAVLWAGAAAFYGFAVNARSHLMEVAFDRKVIPNYAQADETFRQAVQVVAGLALDVPDGVLTFGAIGVWVLVVSWLARRDHILPVPLCILGLVSGSAYLAGVVGYTFLFRPCLVFSIAAGALVTPAWYGWVGILLRRRASQGGAYAESAPRSPGVRRSSVA